MRWWMQEAAFGIIAAVCALAMGAVFAGLLYMIYQVN